MNKRVMLVGLALMLVVLGTSQAYAQITQRVAILEPTDALNISAIDSDCTSIGAPGCPIASYLACTTNGCTPQTPALSGNGEEHAREVTRAALDFTENVEVIVLGGLSSANAQKILWVEQNAFSQNIVSVNISAGLVDCNANLGVPSDDPVYENLRNMNVMVVRSAGNNRCNGFFPAGGDNLNVPYEPSTLFAINPEAHASNTIAVGSGFEIENGSTCSNVLAGSALNENSLPSIVMGGLQVMCHSNAPDDPETASNFFLAFGCTTGFDPQSTVTGNNCGTSFAAPRVAGGIAELRSRAPNLSWQQVLDHLNDAGRARLQRGYDGRQYKSLNSIEDFMPMGCVDGEVAKGGYEYRIETLDPAEGMGRRLITLVDTTCSDENIVSRAWKVSWGQNDLIWAGAQARESVRVFLPGDPGAPSMSSGHTIIDDGVRLATSVYADDQVTDVTLHVGVTGGAVVVAGGSNSGSAQIQDVTTPQMCRQNENSPACIGRIWNVENSTSTWETPQPDDLQTNFVNCAGDSSLFVVVQSNTGAFYAHDVQYYSTATASYETLGLLNVAQRFFMAPAGNSTMIRARSLSPNGWTPWAYKGLDTSSCNTPTPPTPPFGGGLPPFGGW